MKKNRAEQKAGNLTSELRRGIQKLFGRKIADDEHVTITSVSGSEHVEVDRELLNWTRSFIKKYRPALKALAKK